MQITPAQRLEYAFIAAWLLVMIALPIALWTVGDAVFAPGITIAALFQASAVFYILQRQWGLRRALLTLGIVAVTTWAAEFIGSKTGFPFGDYFYTDRLQPQIGGVPLLIPVAWFMLLPPAWVMAQMIVGEKRRTLARQAAFVLVSAAALTAWDLFLDPQMVARGFWVWEQPSGYFGIPWVNYFGWLLTASIVTILARPARLSIMPLALIYGLVWFLQSIGQAVFWGQPGPAFFGCLAMGGIMVLAYVQQKRRNA
ncbi:MAG: carotenoid biosynthesis protein [Anaerolineae bacterium]|jgi:putative membrane protein|nr:carotenoid biosynthesis protein [Anaerolineae bacterium]